MVLSDSVFAYFPSAQYGESVLEKMFEKANKVVAILEYLMKICKTNVMRIEKMVAEERMLN